MTARIRSLRSRLRTSHLLVVFVGVATVLLASRTLAGRFFSNHINDMGHMMGMSESMAMGIEEGFATSINQALWIAVAASAATALLASTIAANRVLSPISGIRNATRRLATGAYSERVSLPEETELAGLATDVNTLAAALENAEQRRVRLISEVAHELRTPLATIEGYMEGLLDGVFQPTDEVFAATAREAARLKRLTSDLSTLSRAEEGMIQLHFAQTDLGELASDAASRLQLSFADRNVDLRTRISGPIIVQGDADRLTQIFTNLLSNALRHTSPGGRVAIDARIESESAVATVTDDGEGIPGDELELVFERFYRGALDQRTGVGIGLTIARALARLHGGDLVAQSPGPGLGASFELRMPLSVST